MPSAAFAVHGSEAAYVESFVASIGECVTQRLPTVVIGVRGRLAIAGIARVECDEYAACRLRRHGGCHGRSHAQAFALAEEDVRAQRGCWRGYVGGPAHGGWTHDDGEGEAGKKTGAMHGRS